ncbi:Sugar tr domain containing protein, partial [Asbolus verrucosus]
MVYYLVQLILTTLSSSIVDKAGRRPLLIISMAGSALALFIEGTYFYIQTQTSIETGSFSIISVIGLMGFVIIFSLGMQSIPTCMLGELFPTNVKAFALCLADVYFSVMATVASKFLQITKVKYGLYVSFYGFTVCSLIGKPYCGDRWYRWSFCRISQLKKNKTCTLCIDESENSQLPSLIFSATNGFNYYRGRITSTLFTLFSLYYLLMWNRSEKTRKSLKKPRRTKDVDEGLNRIDIAMQAEETAHNDKFLNSEN